MKNAKRISNDSNPTPKSDMLSKINNKFVRRHSEPRKRIRHNNGPYEHGRNIEKD